MAEARSSRSNDAVRLFVLVQALVGVRRFGPANVEFQFEIDRRIVEAAHCSKGNQQLFRNVRKGQADLERGLGHLQIPILMLNDDRHQVGIFLA